MPFDFNSAFMNNPALQYGLNLLGSRGTPNPYAAAQLAMQKMQEAPLNNALMQAQTGRLTAQTDIEKQTLAMQQILQARQIALLDALQKNPEFANIFGGGQTTPTQQSEPPAAPVPLPAESPAVIPQQPMQGTPTMQTGKYGTPLPILQNLAQVESSNNPGAIGPAIPGMNQRAQGLMQILPTTADMLKKQNPAFANYSVSNSTQAIDMADFYLQQLLQKHGGDWSKALAEYGGFKTKDPSGYIAKVMQGVNLGQPAQQAAQIASVQPTVTAPAQVGQPNKGINYALAGAGLSMVGLKGGPELGKVGALMQQQPRRANSWGVDPVTGKVTYFGDPLAEKKQAFEIGPSNIPGMTPQAASGLTEKVFQEQHKSLEESYTKLQPTQQTLMSLTVAKQAAQKLGPFQGTGAETKLKVYKFINNSLGANFLPTEVANANLNKTQMDLIAATMIKQMDPNPNLIQQKLLADALGGIGTDPGALPRVYDILTKTLDNRINAHNKRVGEAAKAGVPLPTNLNLLTSKQIDAQMAQQSAPIAGAPAVGTVKGGYKFLGGNPADKNSWEKQ